MKMKSLMNYLRKELEEILASSVPTFPEEKVMTTRISLLKRSSPSSISGQRTITALGVLTTLQLPTMKTLNTEKREKCKLQLLPLKQTRIAGEHQLRQLAG